MNDVTDHPALHRYEIRVDGELAGFSAYTLADGPADGPADGRIAFTHTEIAEAYGGRGLGTALVREELDDVRRRGLAVLPFCPFVRDVVAADPDRYLDLVPPGERARFDLPSPPHDAGRSSSGRDS